MLDLIRTKDNQYRLYPRGMATEGVFVCVVEKVVALAAWGWEEEGHGDDLCSPLGTG